jgi:hypothetical protein
MSSQISTLLIETEQVCKMLIYLNNLIQLSAQDNFTEFVSWVYSNLQVTG